MVEITGVGLRVITEGVCKRQRPLQAVITGESGHQALQDEAVITSNRPAVIGPLDMSPSDHADPVIAIESTYGTPVPNPPTQIEEKTCCQPAAQEPDRHAERDASRAEALFDRTPRWCASCGSRAVFPLFWDVDLFGCSDCTTVMSGRGD